jgi:uncharacterized coiled-coil protein SlyX
MDMSKEALVEALADISDRLNALERRLDVQAETLERLASFMQTQDKINGMSSTVLKGLIQTLEGIFGVKHAARNSTERGQLSGRESAPGADAERQLVDNPPKRGD